MCFTVCLRPASQCVCSSSAGVNVSPLQHFLCCFFVLLKERIAQHLEENTNFIVSSVQCYVLRQGCIRHVYFFPSSLKNVCGVWRPLGCQGRNMMVLGVMADASACSQSHT